MIEHFEELDSSVLEQITEQHNELKLKSATDKVRRYFDDLQDVQYSGDLARLEYIAGKWYIDENEITDIKGWLLYGCKYSNFSSERGYFKKYFNLKETEISSWLDAFIAIQNIVRPDTKDAYWYDNYIVKEAKKPGDIKPLAYPLNNKELKLIHELLFYKGDKRKITILSGIGGSGKSTFGNLVQQLFSNDIAAIDLDSIKNRFTLSLALRHKLIYGDDLQNMPLEGSFFKTITSGALMSVEQKYQDAQSIKPQSALLFNCNKPPHIDISDTGMLRRIVYYYKNTKIADTDIDDPNLVNKKYTTDELINIARAAYQIDMKNWFKDFEEETHDLLSKYNSVRLFKTTNYAIYKQEAIDNGYKPYSRQNWEIIHETFDEWGVL